MCQEALVVNYVLMLLHQEARRVATGSLPTSQPPHTLYRAYLGSGLIVYVFV